MSFSEPALVIVGGGAAGLAAAVEAARWRPGGVLVVDQAPVVSVGTCGLPYMVGGQIEPQSLILNSPQELEQRGVRLLTDCRLESIDLQAQRLHYRGGSLPFEKLLLAPGGHFKFPGSHLSNVLSPRDFTTSLKARAWLQQPDCRKVLVVGAGYLGLELAEAARFAGKHVTLVDPCQRMLGLAEPLHAVVLRELARHGVEWRQHQVVAWEGQPRARQAVLRDGTALDFDLALLATGITPGHPLLAGLPLERGPLGGLRVDRQGRTSRAQIWAAGDCCEIPSRQGTRPTYQPLARPAALLGQAAGAAAMGQPGHFAGCIPCAAVKVFDLQVGWAGCLEEGLLYYSRGPLRAAYWPDPGRLELCLSFCPQSKRLLGAQAVGSGEVSSLLQTLALAIDQGLDLEALTRLDHPYTPPLSGMWNPIGRTVRSSKRWA